MALGTLAGHLGKGLVAGAIGTAAMTVSSSYEMRRRDRSASTAPAQAAAAVLRVKPVDEAAEARFNNLVHWAYGTGWGAVRGILGAMGFGFVGGTVAHFGLVVGSEQAMLPALGIAPPASEWGAEEIVVDAAHHAVYVVVTSIAYSLLRRG